MTTQEDRRTEAEQRSRIATAIQAVLAVALGGSGAWWLISHSPQLAPVIHVDAPAPIIHVEPAPVTIIMQNGKVIRR